MNRRRTRVLGVLLVVFALWALRTARWRPLGVTGAPFDDSYVRVPGVVHVHTTLSDGGGTPDEVIAAARAAGLAFVVLTDHNNLDAKAFEGYRDGVLVIVGTEISTGAGHVLGLGIPDPAYRFSGDVRDALQDIRDLGGAAFAAHPVSPRADFQWTGWEEPGPWGIELLNGDSQWRAAGVSRLAGTLLRYPFNRGLALLSSLTPPREALARWDTLLRERDVPGMLGADAHSRVPVRKEKAVRFPSYESLFALARNHVLLTSPLTREAARDTAAVLEALSHGRVYVGLDALAPAGGFGFVAERDGARWTMGETVAPGPGLRLRAGGALPNGSRVRLLKDGQLLVESEGAVTHENVAPGVYRVEVHVPRWKTPWVLSNPIYVFDDAAARQRRDHAAWPPENEVPTATSVLDTFDTTTSFEAAADSTSLVERPVVDPAAGEDGRGAARLAFRLSAPNAGQTHPYGALVDRTPRDLTGRQGLVFKIRGDGEYRLWVQVRDANPASADEGTEWWFASVKTSGAWRRVALPFSRLRSINPKTDGRLDLDKVRAIVLVLDRGALRLPARGTIWIDDLGVY